jgi:hypothetical protein
LRTGFPNVDFGPGFKGGRAELFFVRFVLGLGEPAAKLMLAVFDSGLAGLGAFSSDVVWDFEGCPGESRSNVLINDDVDGIEALSVAPAGTDMEPSLLPPLDL